MSLLSVEIASSSIRSRAGFSGGRPRRLRGREGRNAGVVGESGCGTSNIVQVIAGYRDINVTMGPVRSQLISGLSMGRATWP
jgi:ABC-type glutathione transport system ATPase component